MIENSKVISKEAGLKGIYADESNEGRIYMDASRDEIDRFIKHHIRLYSSIYEKQVFTNNRSSEFACLQNLKTHKLHQVR